MQPRRRLRIVVALLALATLTWGAAAFTVGARAGKAEAAPPPQFEYHDLVLAQVEDGQTYYIKIEMLMFAGPSGAVEPSAVDTARAEMRARFPHAYEVGEGSVSAQYVLTGFKWQNGVANWSYNSAGEPGGVAGSAAMALQAAAGTWGSAGAGFHFAGGGPTSAGTGACGGVGGAARDAQNTVGWAEQSGSVLAVTCSWYGNGFASEFDMQIDPGWNWTTGSPITIDLQSVALHEFGHALGLQHSGTPSAVMYASYSAGANKRALTADDVDGVMALYGGGGASTPTATPTPKATNTPKPTNTPAPLPTSTPTRQPGNTPASTPWNNPPVATPTSAATATRTPAKPTSTPTRSAATATSTRPASTSIPATPTATPTRAGTGSAATPKAAPSATATPRKTSTPKNALPIVPGSNLLTWPGGDASPAEALGDEGGVLRIVYAWDPATRTWLRYAPGLPSFLNNLTLLRAGQPYWFIANSALQLPFTR